MAIKFYFPLATFLSYVNMDTSILSDKYALFEAYNKFNEPKLGTDDVDTTVKITYPMKLLYLTLRNKLLGKRLGVDVVLEFKKDDLELFTEEEVETLTPALHGIDPKELPRIRKVSIASRILVTDMIYRLYYRVYGDMKDAMDVLNKIRGDLMFVSDHALLAVDAATSHFKSMNVSGNSILHVVVPEMLIGFVGSVFPWLSFSTVFRLALLNIFASDRYRDFGLAPPQHYLDFAKKSIEEFVENYRQALSDFIERSVTLVSEDNLYHAVRPLMRDGMTILELMAKAERAGISSSAVYSILGRLVSMGKVRVEGDGRIRIIEG